MLLEGDTDIDLDGGLMAKSDGKAGLRFLDITHKLYFRTQANYVVEVIKGQSGSNNREA